MTDSRLAPVLILGMHRSGTSCLTGCLEEAGLYLGKVNTQAGFNKKGNRENRDIMKLHESVLTRHGFAWDHPPSGPLIWSAEEGAALDAIIAGYPQDQIWGTKDPRVLMVMDAWQARTQPRFIGTFRHPVEVAASLMNRARKWNQDMSQAQAFKLWLAYNGRMLSLYSQTPFDILRYDVDGPTYEKNLRSAAGRLGLTVPDPLQFFDAALHNQQTQADIPLELRPVWDALIAVSV